MEPHDNYYETAVVNFRKSLDGLGPETTAQHNSPAMYYLIKGMELLARGLLQESRETASRLAELAKRQPPPR
jgi:hypothetical protein